MEERGREMSRQMRREDLDATLQVSFEVQSGWAAGRLLKQALLNNVINLREYAWLRRAVHCL